MKNSFGLIYFIHDDIEGVFQLNIIPTLLKARFNNNIRIVVIHNIRKVQLNGQGKEVVTYASTVQDIRKNDDGTFSFNPLMEGIRWQDAFMFALDELKQSGHFERIGLITLSHSNGLVINRNNDPLEVINDPFTGQANVSSREIVRRRNFKSMEKDLGGGNQYVNTVTILDEVKNSRINAPVYEVKYARDIDKSFCKKYEGLFLAQFSEFLTKALDITRNPDNSKVNSQKLVFFISSNCNFQLYDNVFLLAPLSEFIMGAQSRNTILFWDLPLIVETIDNSFNISNTEIARRIFSNCKEKFENERTETIKHYFLTDTQKFMALHPMVDAIFEDLINRMGEDGFSEKLLKQLDNLKVTSNDMDIPYFDIMQFFEKANELLDGKLADLESLKKEMSEAVILKFLRDGDDLSGFSIYLPRNLGEFEKLKGPLCNYFNDTDGVVNAFSNETLYDDFLKAIFSPTQVITNRLGDKKSLALWPVIAS